MNSKRVVCGVAVLAAIGFGVVITVSGDERTSIDFDLRVMPSRSVFSGVTTLRLENVANPAIVREIELRDGRGRASEAPASEWRATLQSPQHWLAPRTIAFPASGSAVTTLDAWPAATLTARLTAPPGKVPERVEFFVESIAGRETAIARRTEIGCPVTQGRFTCTIPATKLHLVLRVPSMTPRYFWDIVVPAHQTKDLGTVTLKPGASFTAYLERDLASSLEHPASARLVRPVPNVPSENTARLSIPAAEGEFDRAGFVQLAPVSAGTYNLEVRAKGYAVATIGPIEIYEGKETSFRKSIELARPVSVTINVDPPANPKGKPWQIRWARTGEFAPADAAVVAQTDADGRAVIEGQSPGLFLARLSDGEGNELWYRDVRVEDHDTAIDIELPLHAVKGRVTVGNEPLRAALSFGTIHGAVHVNTTSDAEGEFATQLPRLGRWPVEVTSEETQLRAIVDVDIKEGGDVAIRLPDTLIEGRVTGSDGQPVSRGSIAVASSGNAFSSALDAKGEFRLRGIPEGAVYLSATDRMTGEGSNPITVQLRNGQPLRNVELRIEKEKTFSGRVTSAGRPVAGAEVSASPHGGGAVAQAVTGVDGDFKLNLAERTTRVLIVVGAPNRTLQSFDVPVTADPPAFDVAPSGGTLDIRWTNMGRVPFTLTRNGVAIPLTSLISWIFAHGQAIDDAQHLRVPDLAPGEYRACSPSGKCVGGMLAPGATLALQVPD
jgi:hypothetical protein